MIKIKCIYSKVKHITEGKEYLLLEKFKNRVIIINDIGKRSSIKITGGGVRVYFDFSKPTPSTELSITDVVHSFGCIRELNNAEKCEEQCVYCKAITPKAPV